MPLCDANALIRLSLVTTSLSSNVSCISSKYGKDQVPSYQTAESNDKIGSLSNEDFFSYLDPNNSTNVSIAHGRLTPRSLQQARLLVDKIIQYEAKPTRGTWKNVITIVADDLYEESDHTIQANSLAVNTPKDFEVFVLIYRV